MMKTVFGQPKWLVGLIILVVGILLIGGCCLLGNQLPVISSLIASNEAMTEPSGSCQIQCNAQDPDGDKLSYDWQTDDGHISGESSTVRWVAPDVPGAYIITVEVTDGRGGIATEQITINVVAPNHPPVIESLTRDWHNNKLKKAADTNITCVATDPNEDELTYKWTATDEEGNPAGNFIGEGDIVTWVAPNNYGYYTITVTVSDGRGGEASASVPITVCGCADAQE